MLFASGDSPVVWLAIALMVAIAVIKGLIALAKAQEMAELKKRSPEAWARIKQMEHEKEMMARQAEEQKKQRRHRTGMTVASILGDIFLRK